MPNEILLLAEPVEAEDLAQILRGQNGAIPITPVATLAQLKDACAAGAADKRLVAFCTPVIVPADILKALRCDAYNFHPGPPTYPGLFPSCFAIYHGATRFGATAHVMAEDVDTGPIVGVEWVDIPNDIDRLNLEAMSYRLTKALFGKLAPQLVNSDGPLAPIPEQWSGPVTRRRDFDALCELPAGVDREEFLLRYRAVGEGPDHALFVRIHGVRFRLDSGADYGTVFVGGRETRVQES